MIMIRRLVSTVLLLITHEIKRHCCKPDVLLSNGEISCRLLSIKAVYVWLGV